MHYIYIYIYIFGKSPIYEEDILRSSKVKSDHRTMYFLFLFLLICIFQDNNNKNNNN